MFKYQKLDQVEHVLRRSDMYVSSTSSVETDEWVFSGGRLHKKTVRWCPALLQIFREPLSNAVDNVARGGCKEIRVTIAGDEVAIRNDGACIPVSKDNADGCWNHSLIFGKLMTSSNYDDSADRSGISGRNGIGVKACNIFSKKFEVTGVDAERGLKLVQRWSGNMRHTSGARVTKSSEDSHTEVRWRADWSRFDVTGYTDDHIGLMKRYCADAAMVVGDEVAVFFNGERLPVGDLLSYSKLIAPDVSHWLHRGTDMEAVIAEGCGDMMSWVNGVATNDGGSHVDCWRKWFYEPAAKKVGLKSRDVERHFTLLVNIRVPRPRFDSQNKSKLVSPINISPPEIDWTHITNWEAWERMEAESLRQKINADKKIRKAAERPRGFVKIEGLDSANRSGGARSHDCTLILTEGLSAKTFAVAGIEVGWKGKRGRDWFGIYPLRGKMLNVRNAKIQDIMKNKVVSDIVKTLNLRYGMDYTSESNFRKLHYGRVMILTDPDNDGIHITSLIQNMFHFLWPSLTARPFLFAMQTPIVKIKDVPYYNEVKSTHAKYYKGLGTFTQKDINDVFGKKIIEFSTDRNCDEQLSKAFLCKNASKRRQWIQHWRNTPRNECLWSCDYRPQTQKMNIGDWINTRLVKFSWADCSRSIPHLMDGLKESQRKILYACFLKKLNFEGESLKVAQLAGWVAEKTQYHHGEQNLYDTIVKMAQTHVGSNNINLLHPDGQFGSRLSAKDAASARYIFTKLARLTRLIYLPIDDQIAPYIQDEIVEPEFLLPIIPMVLVNGCSGIGTGSSTYIPPHNPVDVIDATKKWIRGEPLPDHFQPWWKGWTGTVSPQKNSFVLTGSHTADNDKIQVSELPIGIWTDSFKDHVESLCEQKIVKRYTNNSSADRVDFTIQTFGPVNSTTNIIDPVKLLKLRKKISIDNMVLFSEGNLVKFESVADIIEQFCNTRLLYYIARRRAILKKLDSEIEELDNQIAFLSDVVNRKIAILGKNEKHIARAMQRYKNPAQLLEIPVKSMSSQKISALATRCDQLKSTRSKISSTSPKGLWLNDIQQLEHSL